MSNTEKVFKTLVVVYSQEYFEQKRCTFGELPEVFHDVRNVRIGDYFIDIIYGKTDDTLQKAVIQKQHVLSYHYYLSSKHLDATSKGKEEE